MDALFVVEPALLDRTSDSDLVKKRRQLQSQIGDTLRSLLLSRKEGHNSELRMWLAEGLAAAYEGVDTGVKVRAFMEHLDDGKRSASGHLNAKYTTQMLLMLCQRFAKEMGSLLASEHNLFMRFFSESDERISRWFSHFSFSGSFKFGAVALEKYAFANRDTIWGKLKWEGRYSLTPVVAASKRHEFMRMDVVGTVRELLKDERFWVSPEFRDSLRSGEFLAIEYQYFVNEMYKRLRNHDISGITRDYIASESLAVLCPALLMYLSDRELTDFLKMFQQARMEGDPPRYCIDDAESHASSNAFVLRHIFQSWKDDNLNELMFQNALVSNGSAVLRYVQDHASAEKGIQSYVREFLDSMDNDRLKDECSHWALREAVARDGQSAEFVAIEVFLWKWRAANAPLDRSNVEDLLKRVGVAFELVKTSKSEKKKRKRSSLFGDSIDFSDEYASQGDVWKIGQKGSSKRTKYSAREIRDMSAKYLADRMSRWFTQDNRT